MKQRSNRDRTPFIKFWLYRQLLAMRLRWLGRQLIETPPQTFLAIAVIPPITGLLLLAFIVHVWPVLAALLAAWGLLNFLLFLGSIFARLCQRVKSPH